MAKKSAQQDQRGDMLEAYFIDALKDIYGAEKSLTKALPKMAKAATSVDLKKAFLQHLEVTKRQVTRLNTVFEKLGKRAQGKKCEAMEGLIAESEEIISETEEDTFTRDVALIMAAQKVEHHEIATYGGLVQLARTLGKKGIASVLESTLNEEKKTDALLTQIAEEHVNVDALQEIQETKKGLLASILS